MDRSRFLPSGKSPTPPLSCALPNCSRKGFSPSRKLPSSPFSGECDENDFIPNGMNSISKPPNAKKPGIKHFMSPTESAKAKVVVKKVLGESCDGAKVPPKPRWDGRFTACSYSSRSDDEDTFSTKSWDASLKPYDPKTNYESPRPKYLRYRPREMSLSLISQNHEFIERENGPESDNEPQQCPSESEAEKEDDHEEEYNLDEEKGYESDQEPQECSSESSVIETEKKDDNAEEYNLDEEKGYESDQEPQEFSLKSSVFQAQKEGDHAEEYNADDEKESDQEPQACSSESSVVEVEKEDDQAEEYNLNKGHESDQEPQECPLESSVIEAVMEIDHLVEYKDNEVEEEEEDEELEEEKGGSLKWIVRFLLLLAALTLLTSYISTMNDPTPSPVVEAVGVLRDGFNHMHKYLSEAIFPNVDSNIAWVNGSSRLHTSNVQAGFLESNTEIVLIAEPSDDCEMEDLSDLEFAEEQEADFDEETDHFPEFEINDSDLANDQESVAMDAVVQIPYGIIDDCQISDGVKEPDRLSELEITESAVANDRGSDDAFVQIPSGIIDDSQISEGNQSENDHSFDKDEEAADFVIMESEEQVEHGAFTVKSETLVGDEEVKVDSNVVIVEGDEQLETDTLTVESETPLRDEELKVDPEFTAEEGFNWLYILYTAIIASLACIYYSVRAKQTHAPDSLHEVPKRKERLRPERPLVEFQHKPKKAAISGETTKVQHAPIVELLAEMSIEEPSSSLRSSGQKGKAKTEENSVSEDYSSHGSFMAEKSILRKQARREKVEKEVPTPVRRSSRIRKLSIASP